MDELKQREIWKNRWTAVVRHIRIVHSDVEEKALLSDLAHTQAARVVGFVNAHAMNSIATNEPFFNAISNAEVLLLDGLGMRLLYTRLATAPGLNMNGTDLIPKILSRYRGRTVALWGTTEPYVTQAAKRCESQFGVEVVSKESGFHEFDYYIAAAKNTRPELIVLGMGMPKQESLALRLRSSAPNAPLIVCGGAILDFLGGKVVRAPRWTRKVGMEWLYRLCMEPKRLFKRYVVGNPLFIFRVLNWRVGNGVGSTVGKISDDGQRSISHDGKAIQNR